MENPNTPKLYGLNPKFKISEFKIQIPQTSKSKIQTWGYILQIYPWYNVKRGLVACKYFKVQMPLFLLWDLGSIVACSAENYYLHMHWDNSFTLFYMTIVFSHFFFFF